MAMSWAPQRFPGALQSHVQHVLLRVQVFAHTRLLSIYSPQFTLIRFPRLFPQRDDWSLPSVHDLWVSRRQGTMHRDICSLEMSRLRTQAKSTFLPLRLTQASRVAL